MRKAVHAILKLLRDIWLGVLLILVASLLLLYSDLHRRNTNKSGVPGKSVPRLAVMQWSSTDLLDHTVQGMVEGLKQQGFEHGRTADIRFLNASGDGNTGNIMARDMAAGGYDLVLTASTLGLQAVAKANHQGKVMHLFGAVTDPYGAGVGITGPRPDQHPPHLVGVGSFQPVERAFQLARLMNPALRKVGVVWNPGESNSEACLKKARAKCSELDIELIEVTAGSTSEVPEAVRSVLARSVEAIWVGGDIVAISSLGAIVSAANTSKIPVFTNDSSDSAKGALFGVGASYQKVGFAVGEMAGKILRGADPKSFGVENLVPEKVTVNESVVTGFAGWSIPDEVLALVRATSDNVLKAAPGTPGPPPGAATRCWEIRLVRYNDAQFAGDAFRGIMDGFSSQGLRPGQDFNATCLNAQGDMTTLSSIMTAVRNDQPDLVMAISTPALQATLRQGGGLPTVFCAVADAVRAGGGTSESNHLPYVTGVTTRSPFNEMAQLIKESVPGVRAVGTLFSPAEINSELYREWFDEALKAVGLELVAVPVNTSADTSEAAAALLRADIQVVSQISDNTTRPAFAQIIKRASEANLAFFCFDSGGLKEGATLALARDYYEAGVEAAAVAVRVLRGESPKDIPFVNTPTQVLAIDKALLEKYGITLSEERMKKAQVGTDEKTP